MEFIEHSDLPPENYNENNFIIVGIGASAGGITALKTFFENVPAVTGMAYVVILHLSPDHDSKLAEIISTVALIPVSQVTERVKVQPDHIYVVPPNQHLEMEDGHIRVTPNIEVEDRRAPVDIFFRTLAESHQTHAVCVVLSGTGANGSMGLKRIKEKGGAAFVQNPREAEFNEMPRNSIATDLVDDVLPVAEIPQRIISYKNNLDNIFIPVEYENKPKDTLNDLKDIFKELRIHTGHDFSNYKRPTLMRRIERRMSLRNVNNLDDYVAFIKNKPEETNALLKDLLISVTNFYRDKKAFETLELEILPVILKRKSATEQVRIWVAGCATGEEAYSIAMLCAEQTTDVADAPRIQIFATDIDEDAIATARDGLYTLNDAADVSPERLRRFFNKEGDGYRIRREIRETILFANHNFIKDPPFSHLDLISCRNVLIYLNRSAQERVMETFHFALNRNGYLFIGTSESVDAGGNLYEVVSRDGHIFKSRPVVQHNYQIPETVPAFRVDQPQSVQAKEKTNRLLEQISYGQLHQRLLEQYAAPSLVVNEEFDIVHMSENAGAYLHFAAGEPSQNLFKMLRQELRLEIRAALYQSIQQKIAVEVKNLLVKSENGIEIVSVNIKPIFSDDDIAKGFILIVFEKNDDLQVTKLAIDQSNDSIARHLEDELTRVKTQLRGSNEQHDFQAEELKASNEELQAMNEELRSAAEELETSKEELQSMNEELRTVNQELKVKIDETSINSNNLQNLINSTSIGTIFLDRRFRVAMFTPSISDIFNLIPADYGRAISDITHKLQYDGLLQDAEKVMEKLTIIEHEVKDTENRIFLMRLLPYRTSEDHINGVVITFVDISKRKLVEESLRQSQEIYRTVLSSIEEGFCILEMFADNPKSIYFARYIDANDAFFSQSALPKTVIGQSVKQNMIFGQAEFFKTVALDGKPAKFQFDTGTLPTKRWFEAFAMQIGDHSEHRVAIFYNNITEHKYRELNAAFLVEINDDFNRLSSSAGMVHAVVDKLKQFYDISWVSFAETDEENNEITFLNNNDKPAFQTSDKQTFSGYLSEGWITLLKTGEIIAINDVDTDLRIESEREEYHKNEIGAQLIAPFVRNGQLLSFITLHNKNPYNWRKDQIDLLQELAPRIYQRLERVKAEDELMKSDERLKKAFSIETVGVVFFKPNGTITSANDAFFQMCGYSHDDLKNGLINWDVLTPDNLMPQWLAVVEQFLTDGRTTPYEKQLKRKDGTRLWTLVSITSISEEEGVEFIIDISEQKLLQQQKDEFIAIASHELKTPVTSIKVYAEILQETFEKTNDTQNAELIGKLDGQLNRLAKLIGDLLDTTRISEGQLVLDLETFDLNDLIKERLEEMQRLTNNHQLIFRPASIKSLVADRERISQVLVNLISNAIKYSPEGGEIVIFTEEHTNGVKVSIEDKGIGIPSLLLNSVFERFFRINNPQIQTYPGIGLGLFISAAIIHRHGGIINVESIENNGSLFSFVLPYQTVINT